MISFLETSTVEKSHAQHCLDGMEGVGEVLHLLPDARRSAVLSRLEPRQEWAPSPGLSEPLLAQQHCPGGGVGGTTDRFRGSRCRYMRTFVSKMARVSLSPPGGQLASPDKTRAFKQKKERILENLYLLP